MQTLRHPKDGTNRSDDPKVGGSNPPPATKKDQVRALPTGRALLQPARHPYSNPGFELTFSVSKSTSLRYGLSERDVSATVCALHADAVSQALD